MTFTLAIDQKAMAPGYLRKNTMRARHIASDFDRVFHGVTQTITRAGYSSHGPFFCFTSVNSKGTLNTGMGSPACVYDTQGDITYNTLSWDGPINAGTKRSAVNEVRPI